MPTNYQLSPKELVVGLVNTDNSLSIPITAVTLSLPSIVENLDGQPAYNNRKTAITLTAVPGEGYTNSVEVKYNRIHYRDIFPHTGDNSIEFPVATDTFALGANNTLADIIPAINALRSINLQTTDYVEKALPTFSGFPPYLLEKYVLLEAKPEAPIYIGGINLRIMPNLYPLESFSVTTLNGFDNLQIPAAWGRVSEFVDNVLTAPGYW